MGIVREGAGRRGARDRVELTGAASDSPERDACGPPDRRGVRMARWADVPVGAVQRPSGAAVDADVSLSDLLGFVVCRQALV